MGRMGEFQESDRIDQRGRTGRAIGSGDHQFDHVFRSEFFHHDALLCSLKSIEDIKHITLIHFTPPPAVLLLSLQDFP